MKMYGPYTRKDGRKHAIIIHDDGRRQTKSWPRVLMERHLGRELTEDETVDHINNDFTDDRIENLQLLSWAENVKKEAARNPRELYKFICPECGDEAVKFMNNVKGNWKKGKKGPFCSRVCSGLFNSKV